MIFCALFEVVNGIMIRLKARFLAFIVIWFELGVSLIFQQKTSLCFCSNEKHHGSYSPCLILFADMLLTFNCLSFGVLNVLRLCFRDFGKCYWPECLFISGFQTHRHQLLGRKGNWKLKSCA